MSFLHSALFSMNFAFFCRKYLGPYWAGIKQTQCRIERFAFQNRLQGVNDFSVVYIDLWKNAFSPEDVARGYDGMREAYDHLLMKNFPLPASAKVEALELNGVSCLRVGPKHPRSGPTVLHFHGGAYVIGSAKASVEYASRLADGVEGHCISVEYRLAPDHPYPAAIDDAINAYRGLLATGVAASDIFLSGESSGGGLALALAIAIRHAALPMPAGILAACPFADLTLSSESLTRFHGDDPAANRDMLSYLAASYFQGHEPTDPLVSPVFGDLHGLPPLFLTAATNEVLFNDTTRLAERANAAGLNITLKLVDDSVHIFPVLAFLPEARATMDEFAVWAKQIRMGSTEQPRAA